MERLRKNTLRRCEETITLGGVSVSVVINTVFAGQRARGFGTISGWREGRFMVYEPDDVKQCMNKMVLEY